MEKLIQRPEQNPHNAIPIIDTIPSPAAATAIIPAAYITPICTPVLDWELFFFYFFFPIVLDIRLDVFFTVVLTYVLNYAAYFSEIYRGGINSIDKGQYEAAHALGISKGQTMKDIILPQTMKAVLPPTVNETANLVKDTALASTLPVVDLMKAANSAVNRLTDITPFIFAAIIYFIMTLVVTLIAGRIEKYFSRYDEKGEDK